MKSPIRLMAAALLALCALRGAAADRHLVNTIWFGGATPPDWTRLARYVETCKERGCTAVSFDISWNIETREDRYDFALADRLADEVTSRGMALFIRVNTSLLGGQRPKWLTDAMLMRNASGRVYTRRGREALPALTHPMVRKKMARFYTAAADHFARRRRTPVVCYSAAFDLYMESEYFPADEFDYSPASQEAFLKWLDGQTRGSDIKELNAAWGTKYDGLGQVKLTNAPAALRQRFFAWTLDDTFTLLSRSLKAGDPSASFGVQFGCLWDNPRRRSMLADLRSPAIDWVFVADAPRYNHAFSVDMLRASARGKMVANEIDGPIPNVMTDAIATSQGLVSLAHGVDAVFICNWPLEKFADRAAWTFPDRLARAAREAGGKPRPRRAMYVSTWDLINLTAKPAEYQAVYDKLTGPGERSLDVLNDCALLADAKRLEQYDEIILPVNRTISAEARQALERLPKSMLRIMEPGKAGLLDEFGKMGAPLAGK